ncbi:MAG TPA: HDOD domain-containing protein [Desulfuromonadales bacterium]|nr:HDOD domain-containing protein [Desulfuromonadales bacterium]
MTATQPLLSSEDVRLKLFHLKEIPPPSGSAQIIMNVAADDHVDLTKVVSLIEKSPELAARILKCANSAYYGQRSQIYSVREAVIRVLGLSVTKSLILAMALCSSFRFRPCEAFNKELHWFTSITTATLAQDLSRKLLAREKPAPGTAYTAGLIHNLGVLALLQAFPQQMEQVFTQNSSEKIRQAMIQLIGIDHQIAGGWLAQRWGLPDNLVCAITHHENPSYHDTSWPLVRLIGLSAQIASGLYHGGVTKVMHSPYIENEIVAQEDIEEAARRILDQIDKLKGLAQLLSGEGRN